MFHAYLSHAQARAYLAELMEQGLVETDIFNSRKYIATSKGVEYLQGLERMAELFAIDIKRSVKGGSNVTYL
jgi:predicted transcriptional regulator